MPPLYHIINAFTKCHRYTISLVSQCLRSILWVSSEIYAQHLQILFLFLSFSLEMFVLANCPASVLLQVIYIFHYTLYVWVRKRKGKERSVTTRLRQLRNISCTTCFCLTRQYQGICVQTCVWQQSKPCNSVLPLPLRKLAVPRKTYLLVTAPKYVNVNFSREWNNITDGFLVVRFFVKMLGLYSWFEMGHMFV